MQNIFLPRFVEVSLGLFSTHCDISVSFYLYLTMSAELMVWGLLSVVRPFVASIIAEPIAWIPFKFWLLLPLDHMPDPFFLMVEEN